MCMSAIGTGANVTVANLKEFTQRLGIDLNAEVKTTFGIQPLLHVVFVENRRVDFLRYLFDHSLDITIKADEG